MDSITGSPMSEADSWHTVWFSHRRKSFCIWCTCWQNMDFHHFNFDTFRPYGFIDDFSVPTACPGDSPNRRQEFAQNIQRAIYSGYLHAHGLKAQLVYLPIGVIESVYITDLWQNDNGVQNRSGLNNYLLELLHGILVWCLFPALYCDGIFSALATILSRFKTHHHSCIFKLAFGFIMGMHWTCLGWSSNALWFIFSSKSITFIQQWSQNLKDEFSFLLCIELFVLH